MYRNHLSLQETYQPYELFEESLKDDTTHPRIFESNRGGFLRAICEIEIVLCVWGCGGFGREIRERSGRELSYLNFDGMYALIHASP